MRINNIYFFGENFVLIHFKSVLEVFGNIDVSTNSNERSLKIATNEFAEYGSFCVTTKVPAVISSNEIFSVIVPALKIPGSRDKKR